MTNPFRSKSPETPTPPGEKKVLLICTGNTCRSPMAMTLVRKALGPDAANYVVESAGVSAHDEPASEHAQTVMQERGLDLSQHRSRRLTREMLDDADIVFTLSQSHYAAAKRLSPEANIHMLREEGISDPFGGNVEKYRRSADDIEKAVQDRLQMIREVPSKPKIQPA